MKIRRMFISLVAIVVALYAVLLFAAFFGQRKLIYPIPSAAEPSLANGHIERFAVPGVALGIALYAPARSTGLHQPTIVHFHGNGEDLAGVASLVQMLHASGLGVYAVEYPGYGLARPGAPSESAIFATAQAAIEHLVTALGVPRQSIVLEGQSLGTGVAAEMAHRGLGARLILISPYTSMTDMAALTLPFLPARWLLRDRYDTERFAAQLTLPMLVIHGTDDEVIPVRMGQRIAALAPHAEFMAITGGHHTDLFARDAAALIERIAAFARGQR